MAEGLFNLLAKDRVLAFSAGVSPEGYVHPLAIRVMDELDLDMKEYQSKSVDLFVDDPFDVVITVCDSAAETCPTFPGAPLTLHWPTDDPFDSQGDEDTQLAVYRRVRDELRERIEGFLTEYARSTT
jgi:arsenate reductase